MLIYYVYFDPAITNIPGLSILVSATMITVLLYCNFNKRLQGGLLKELSYEGKAYIVFFALIFIPGLLTSPYLSSYLYSYLKGIQFAVLFISVYFVVIKNKDMDLILKVLGISIIAYAITTYFFGIIEPGTGRLMISERAEPNGMAILMYIGIVLVTYFWNKGLIYKILSIGYIPIAMSNIALSGSRKGFIGTAIFLFLFFLCSYLPSLKKKNVMIALISLIVIVALAVVLFDKYAALYSNSILFERLNWKLSDSSSTGRMEMYQIAFNLVKEYPFFGVGYDNFKSFSGLGVYSHSTYAEVLSCTGIIGTLIYLSIYISITRKLIRLYISKWKQKLSVYIEGILLSFMIVDFVYAFVKIDLNDPVTYVFFAWMVGYYEINKKYISGGNTC